MNTRGIRVTVPIIHLVEENCNSIASSFIQRKNLEKFQLLEESENELKTFMDCLLKEFNKLSRDKIKREIKYVYDQLLFLDKKQDEIIASVLNLSMYIGKINKDSNGLLKRYDVKGNYKEHAKIYEKPTRNQLLLYEEVEEYDSKRKAHCGNSGR